MKQRVVIAMALVMKPSIVILDEPTSALDVMTQANIMNLLKGLKRNESLSYLFITHDLGLSSELADVVGIMYAGRIIEVGPAEKIYPNPQHPYTQKLLASAPKLRTEEKPDSIPGAPPDLIKPPAGCRFHPRCPFVFDKCRVEPAPPFFGDVDRAACWLLEPGR
jgi:peptide/nickel transport system ATP-binding protein